MPTVKPVITDNLTFHLAGQAYTLNNVFINSMELSINSVPVNSRFSEYITYYHEPYQNFTISGCMTNGEINIPGKSVEDCSINELLNAINKKLEK